LMARHYDEAIATADRALAVDPRSIVALTYKGWGTMEKAKDSPGSADWGAIRGYFSKANHLNPMAAEPLMLYYESYLKQGITPPAEAANGLLGALELAPEDGELRLMSVRQLLRYRDVKTARMLFATIAYDAHTGSVRRRNLEIMDKINAGDGDGALTMLNEDQKKREKEDDLASAAGGGPRVY
jgi:tetratricopeptide (TPR) repeat protein